MKNVLITGVNGFIGSALASALCSDNSLNVVGVGFDKHKDLDVPVNHMVYGDLRDAGFCRRVIGDYEINDVFHLAAQSIVRVCSNDPVSAYDINIMGTVNLLEACRTVGKNTVESVVVSTSDKAYGHSPVPYTEDTPLEPLFTYEASKTCQDIISRSYFHNYGVPVKVARCSNVYGPGDKNLSRLVPRSISLLSKGEAPVLYNGVHNYIREFIYIGDVVTAFLTIADKGAAGEAYCVGGSGHYRILDVITKMVELMGLDTEPVIEDKASNFKEIEAQYIDATKLRSLGWEPLVDLDAGLLASINYYAKG